MVIASVWGMCGLRHSLTQARSIDTCRGDPVSPEFRVAGFGTLVWDGGGGDAQDKLGKGSSWR